MSRQERAPAVIAAADDNNLAAPSSRSRTSAGDGGKDQEEFCARLNRNQRIVITNSEFGGANLEGGRNTKERGASERSGLPIRPARGTGSRGEGGEEKRTAATDVALSMINLLIENA